MFFFHTRSTPLTAEDVKYSLERIIEKKVRAAHLDGLNEIEIISENELILKLDKPNAALLTNLAHPMNAIVDSETAKQSEGRLAQTAMGSGAFRLGEWRPGQRVVLEAFDRYFEEGQPRVERIVLRAISDEGARLMAFQNQEVDLILDVPEKFIDPLKRREGIVLETSPGTFWEYVGFNTAIDKLKDPKRRQALSHAINRDQINNLVKLGHAEVTGGSPLPPQHWAALPDFRPYEELKLQKARGLLSQSDGSSLSLEMILKSDSPNQIEAAQVVRQNWAAVGVDLTLKPLESTLYFQRLGDGDFETTLIGWVGFVDPDEWFFHIFHSEGSWNQQNYSQSKVDQLLDQARRELSREKRAQLYREAQRLIVQDAPMAFLYRNSLSSAWHEGLVGFDVHPTATTTSLRKTGWQK